MLEQSVTTSVALSEVTGIILLQQMEGEGACWKLIKQLNKILIKLCTLEAFQIFLAFWSEKIIPRNFKNSFSFHASNTNA